MNKPRKVPMRKCVATGEMKPKKELVRIVRSKEGIVSVDLTGKNLVEEHISHWIKKQYY